MAEGLAETQRDEETFVGPQEGGTKDQATLGMPAGGYARLWVCVGGLGSCATFPFPSVCLGEVISLHGHSMTKENLPRPSKVEIVGGPWEHSRGLWPRGRLLPEMQRPLKWLCPPHACGWQLLLP